MIGVVISIVLILPPVVLISIVWANLLEKTTQNTEWQENKNNPEYWE